MQTNPHGFVLQSAISKWRLVPRTIALNTNCRSHKKNTSLWIQSSISYMSNKKNPRYFMQQTDHATFNVKKNSVAHMWYLRNVCVQKIYIDDIFTWTRFTLYFTIAINLAGLGVYK